MRTLLLVIAAAGLFFGGVVSCGGSTCSPSNCAGCCTADGRCDEGKSQSLCGAAGVLCNTCTNGLQVCTSQQCVVVQGGGSGGGTATGGGGGGSNADAGSDAGTDAGVPTDGGMTCGPSAVACTDQSVNSLDFRGVVSTKAITEIGTTAGEFLTTVDATAGGLNPTEAYVYAKFSRTGLQKVAITDEPSLDSTAWDIAFRRYVIRLNSGVSGPSCVTAAHTSAGTTFEDVANVGLTFLEEEYFAGATCEYVEDGHGLESPGTVLSSYWDYAGCVKMTGEVFVIALADGHHVKLQVIEYYGEPGAQDMCNDSDTLPGVFRSANFKIRWAYLD